MQRRQILGGSGATLAGLVAGCLDGGQSSQSTQSGPRLADDAWRNINTPTDGNGLNWRADFVLSSGHYAIREYRPEQPINVGYEVETDDTPIDVILTKKTENGFTAYKNGTQFEKLTRGTTLNETVLKSQFELQPGTYVLIFDNTSQGEASGNDEARGSVILRGYKL